MSNKEQSPLLQAYSYIIISYLYNLITSSIAFGYDICIIKNVKVKKEPFQTCGIKMR